MQITVFGASGKVGSLVVEEALRRGYSVVAFVHHHNLFSPSGKLIIVEGDVYNSEQVSTALKGSDAVISCLGSWGTPKKDVLTAAMRSIVPAMQVRDIQRIVTVTGSGANIPGQRASIVHKSLLRLPIYGAGKVFSDGEAHMRLLADSSLKWTTLRSPVMTNGGRKGYYLNMSAGSVLGTISRSAVATALLDQLERDDYLCASPVIHRA